MYNNGELGMLNIKSANADDWDKIYEVLDDAVERQKNVNPLIAWTMDTIKKENILDDFPISDFFIAFDDTEPVGIMQSLMSIGGFIHV